MVSDDDNIPSPHRIKLRHCDYGGDWGWQHYLSVDGAEFGEGTHATKNLLLWRFSLKHSLQCVSNQSVVVLFCRLLIWKWRRMAMASSHHHHHPHHHHCCQPPSHNHLEELKDGHGKLRAHIVKCSRALKYQPIISCYNLHLYILIFINVSHRQNINRV